MRKKQYEESICWKCNKSANGNLCCWANCIPRTDWVAEPTEVAGFKRMLPSFLVKECPDYDDDPANKPKFLSQV